MINYVNGRVDKWVHFWLMKRRGVEEMTRGWWMQRQTGTTNLSSWVARVRVYTTGHTHTDTRPNGYCRTATDQSRVSISLAHFTHWICLLNRVILDIIQTSNLYSHVSLLLVNNEFEGLCVYHTFYSIVSKVHLVHYKLLSQPTFVGNHSEDHHNQLQTMDPKI